jgi:hypothetical protein
MSAEFKARMRFLCVGRNGAFFSRKIRGTTGNEPEFFWEIQIPQIAEERGDSVLESVAGDVSEEQLMADVLSLNAGQVGIGREPVENSESNAADTGA